MPLVLNGTGTVTGLAAGGLPDATITQSELVSGIAGNGPVFASGSTGLTSISATTWTAYTNFSESQFDTINGFNRTTGRYQPNVAGYYWVQGIVDCGYSGVTSTAIYASIFKNGNNYRGGTAGQYASGAYPAILCTSVVYLNGTTDYIQVYCYTLQSISNTSGSLMACMIRSA